MDNQKKKNEYKEQSDADSTASELLLDFVKLSSKAPLTLDIIYGSKSCRCHQESCSCNRELDLSSNVSFSQMTPVIKQRSEIELPGMKLGSCQSTNSLQSTSYSESPITRGQLQCLQKSGMLYFTFSVDDTPQEIYTANPQKITQNAMDCLYSFHLRTNGKVNTSIKHCLNPLHLIAKMKVSNSILLKATSSKIKETEFILYGSQEERYDELQKLSAIFSRSRGFSNKVADIFRSNKMENDKTEDNCGQKIGGLSDVNEFTLASNYRDDLIANPELAAIVVEECLYDSTNDLMVGGWGLKFLEKAGQTNTSSEHFPPRRFSENSYSNRDDSARSMTVLIPAGFHGGPVSKVGGPAGLTDRWRSGGQCDCSGWDIGCPLKVLKNTCICSTASPNVIGNGCNSVSLFMEGTKNERNPTLSMVNTREGLYSICFNSSLSPLQSFSIAVAVIHAEMPGLFPKL